MSRPILPDERPEFTEVGLVRWARQIFEQFRNVNAGKLDNRGSVTLTASTTTTTVDHPGFESSMAVFLSPLTSNAAAAIGTTYISSRSANQFVLTHANNAQTDRDFEYVILG